MFHFDKFVISDVEKIGPLQPPDWGDITPRFSYFAESPNANPVKVLHDGQIIGLGTSIVHPDFRNRGLGELITRTLIDSLNPKIFKTIYLDATELGYAVYQKIGFEMDGYYSHFKMGENGPVSAPSKYLQDLQEDHFADVLELDAEVSAEHRAHVLLEKKTGGKVMYSGSKLLGFYLPELWEGLIVARDINAGISLMEYRAETKQNAVVPQDNRMAGDNLPRFGYTFFRRSRRMYLGEKRSWNPGGIFNRISGILG